MKIDDQVTSLELSKKLKELGIKQESLFYWEAPTDLATHLTSKEPRLAWNDDIAVTSDLDYGTRHPWQNDIWNSYSAFTVAELGKLLPLKEQAIMTWLELDICRVEFYNTQAGKVEASTEADARAKLLIYLLENKFITL